MTEMPAEAPTEVTMSLGPSMCAVWLRNDPYCLVEGPAGSSKTLSDLCMIVQAAILNPGAQIMLVRKTRTSMGISILKTLESEVFPMMGLKVPGNAHRENRFSYHLPGDSEIVPVGMDQPERLFSSKWDIIAGFEGSEFTKDDILSLYRGLRGEVIKVDGKPFRRLIIEVNPTYPDHCLNAEFAEPADDSLRRVYTPEDYERLQSHNFADPPGGRWKRIITKHYDNPGYFNADTWEWTDSGKDYVGGKLEALTGSWRSRMLDGLWRAPSGAVFPEYDETVHVIDDFEPPRDWPCVLGYDPGWHFTAVEWCAMSPDGGFFFFDEIYEGGKSMQEHCTEIIKRNETNRRNVQRFLGDPNEMFSNRAQNISCARQAKEYGLRFVAWPADKGAAFEAGVEMFRHVLRGTIEGKTPYVKICRRCKGLRQNLGSWSFKPETTATVGADRYQAGADHGIDVGRGILSSGYLQRMARNG